MELEVGKLYRLKRWSASDLDNWLRLHERGHYIDRTIELHVGGVFMFLGVDVCPDPKVKRKKALDHFILMPDGRIAWYHYQTWLAREPGHFFERAGKKK